MCGANIVGIFGVKMCCVNINCMNVWYAYVFGEWTNGVNICCVSVGVWMFGVTI